MRARDIIAAVSIPRYWRDHIQADWDLEAEPLVLCPFHNDHHPSMRYNQEKKLCKCFSCGAGGNVIQLHMSVTGIRDYQDAVDDLGKLYKVEEHILTLADVKREVAQAQESIDYSVIKYKALSIAKTLRSPKVYCELDEILTQSDTTFELGPLLKDFIGRHIKDGKLTP